MWWPLVRLLICLPAAALAVSCAEDDLATLPTGPPIGTGVYGQVCAACHGVNGEGKEELFSPSITGLPVWYLEEQLGKFRSGQRGSHPQDMPGQQMRAISLTLSDAQIKEAAATVAAMPVTLTEPPSPGVDLETARFRYANDCMECHRYNGRGGDRVP